MARYCIIGAGAAGLSALRELRRAGHAAECFEKADRVGGHWNTDYDALHLITSRDTTAFEGFPMPADYPHFPRRDQVRDYIASFAQHHDLTAHITFDTEIVSVTPEPHGDDPAGAAGWRVVSSRGDEGVFDGVLVANGHLWDPSVPDVPGDFTGVQLHSSEYRNVGDLSGSRVLVVGAGNSGCDLAVDVAQHRLEADIVVARGRRFQPKTYLGMPRAELPFLSGLSADEQDVANRLLARVSIGEVTDYGLPAPEGETLADGPVTVNDLLLYWIHHGRIGVRPAVESFDGPRVRFTDGQVREYDSILWATGFHPTLPFLDDGLVTRAGRVPVRYAGGILPAGLEKLYFVGLIAPRGPQIPVYGTQMKLVTRMIELHATAGPRGLALSSHFAQRQEPWEAIDVVRDVWNRDMADTERILSALEAQRRSADSEPTSTPAPEAAR